MLRCPWCKSLFADENQLITEQDSLFVVLRSEDGLEGFEIFLSQLST